MFGNRPLLSKRSWVSWGLWVFVLGVGLMVLSAQAFAPARSARSPATASSVRPIKSNESNESNETTVAASVAINQNESNETTVAASVAINQDEGATSPEGAQEIASTEEDFLLPEYDPAKPFLAGEANDNLLLNDEGGSEQEPLPGSEQPLWVVGGGLAFKLALVIGLVYLVLGGLRWLRKGRSGPIKGGATISVLETVGLAPNRALHLVVVGEKTLLIGATDHQLTLLTELAEATLPITDEEPLFDETLSAAEATEQSAGAGHPAESEQSAGVGSLPDVEQPIGVEQPPLQAVTSPPDWPETLAKLRLGIQDIRESIEG